MTTTQLLLGCGASKSLLDLDKVERRDNVSDEDFEICKSLVETSEIALASFQLLLEDETSDTKTLEDVRPSAAEQRIRREIFTMPDQSDGIGNASAGGSGKTEHQGVYCDGPLCRQSPRKIVGTRFKCTVCENVDFCVECLASLYNNHDVRHKMIKCLLPTAFRMVRKLDDIAKRGLLQQSGEGGCEIAGVSHVVYAETQNEHLPEVF